MNELYSPSPIHGFEWGKDGKGVSPASSLLLEGWVILRLQTDFQPYFDGVAFLETLRFLGAHADGHEVPAVLREQGRGPLGPADPHADRYHPPAVCDQSRNCLDLPALPRRDGDEEIRGGTAPVEDRAAEFEAHPHSISNACLPEGE